MGRNNFDKHHRLPRSIGGKNNPRNISYIPRDLHEAWHRLFKNMTAQQIAQRISEWYLDPDYIMLAVKREN